MIAVIADDFTGATDVALAFRRHGLRVAIVFGVPNAGVQLDACDALVIALKSRTIPVAEAVRQSLDSVQWAQDHGFTRFYFKYCSTFDSSPTGNIGPVADALSDHLSADLVVATPASPVHERTVYESTLFVGGQLLSESSMRTHPLTPMTESNLVRVLSAQTERSVGSIRHLWVARGSDDIVTELSRLRREGIRYAIVDAIDDDDLNRIGAAVADHVLVTGAAGLAGGLAAALAHERGEKQSSGQTPAPDDPERLNVHGVAAVLAGSCSARTLEQVELMARHNPAHRLDAVEIPDPERLAAAALHWYDTAGSTGVPLIYSSLAPSELRIAQEKLGTAAAAAELVESAMGRIAQGLIARGVDRLVVAGGETSGAVTTALGVTAGVVGDEAAPGVPWIYTSVGHPLALLLKSGNFGDPELLISASGAERR